MTRKQVTFDLSQEMLKKFYPRGNSKSETFYKKAYSDIQKFMLRNGFSHRQYSVYVSDISAFFQALRKNGKMNWSLNLLKAVKNCTAGQFLIC